LFWTYEPSYLLTDETTGELREITDMQIREIKLNYLNGKGGKGNLIAVRVPHAENPRSAIALLEYNGAKITAAAEAEF